MKILIIGSGAREHAIARALARSPQKPEIYCYATNKNPGIQTLARGYEVGDINQINNVVTAAHAWQIDFAIVGPEAPLANGLVDALAAINIPAIGPSKCLAQLEASKTFTRDLLHKYKIPGSLKYRAFTTLTGAKEFLAELGEGNYVIKADGLMGGKGVKVAGDHLHSLAEAFAYCQELQAVGSAFIIEEKLIGQEFSLLAFCDGEHLAFMPAVQDHKRAFVNDQGPNTGGMGSYSDANQRLPFLAEQDLLDAKQIMHATVQALRQEYPEKYVGILYGSFIATKSGVQLIEYNARFGDPEAMNVLAILESDLVAICQAMLAGNLTQDQVQFSKLATVCKYAVPKGYPDHPVKNSVIDIAAIKNPEQLYFAAVNAEQGKIYATGSRTVAVLGIAKTLAEAEQTAEAEIQRIQGELFHREDIGTHQLITQRVAHMRDLRSKCRMD